MIYADQRWIGNHGIGRFARHVLEGLEYHPVPLTSEPGAPLDSLRLSQALRNLGDNDLSFSPGYNAPLFCRARFIFTIHDLTHIHCPEISKLRFRLYYATVMKRACRRSSKILTVSEFTRKEILEWAGVQPEKVVNVGCGVDPAYKFEGEVYGLPFRYLLSVSNRRPHKNEFRVVEAFARANLDERIHLVFTGNPAPELTRQIELHQLQSRVDFVGVLTEEKMPPLYRGAEALIFPSLYEGFGLPILEAMACGTPVVTSNITAMPEVAGDAALQVDPRSVNEITKAINQVVSDATLREGLRQRGRERRIRFSWVSTANRVHAILSETGSKSSERTNAFPI